MDSQRERRELKEGAELIDGWIYAEKDASVLSFQGLLRWFRAERRKKVQHPRTTVEQLLTALTHSRAMRSKVKSLHIQSFGITDDVLLHIRRNSWHSLTTLDLRHNLLSWKTAALLASFSWPLLTTLTLSANKLNDQAVPHLAAAHWPQLEFLRLDHNPISNEGAAEVMRSKWKSLRVLELQSLRLRKCDLSALPAAAYSRIECLNFSHNKISRRGFTHLVQADLPNLASLYLHGCGLDDEAGAELSKASWSKLTILTLKGNPLGERGMQRMRVGHWPGLNEVWLACHPRFLGCIRSIARSSWGNDSKYGVEVAMEKRGKTRRYLEAEMRIVASRMIVFSADEE